MSQEILPYVIISGLLDFNDRGEYCLLNKSMMSIFFLEKEIHSMLTDFVELKITNLETGRVLINKKGILYFKKIGLTYLIYLNDISIDNILWQCVGDCIKFEAKSLSELNIPEDFNWDYDVIGLKIDPKRRGEVCH